MENIFFGGWQSLLRILVVGVLIYATLLVFLRIAGKRVLSKLNAFDLVVTVALGSTLATVLLNSQIALAEGALAFVVLIGLQFAVTWASVRVAWVRSFVTGQPHMVLCRGEFLPDAMRQMRITEDEVRAAVRSAGMAGLEDVAAVVLETDGSLNVVRRSPGAVRSSLEGVE